MADRPRPPLDGAAVLITGASAGIGRELARQLGGRASTLILLARGRSDWRSCAPTCWAAVRG